jgi:hypothetical protein
MKNNDSKTLLEIKSLLKGYKRGMQVKTFKKHLCFDKDQYARLKGLGIINYNESGTSVKGFKVNYVVLANKLEISLSIIKNREVTHYGKYVSLNNSHLIFEFYKYAIDWDFVLTASYIYAKEGLESAHNYFMSYKQGINKELEKERASSLNMEEDVYLERKKAGLVDWENGKIYELERNSQDVGTNYNWRFEGRDYKLKNASLYWSSQRELFNEFKHINPTEFWRALGALYEKLGESKESRKTVKRELTEIQRSNRRRAELWDEIEAQNKMYERLDR